MIDTLVVLLSKSHTKGNWGRRGNGGTCGDSQGEGG